MTMLMNNQMASFNEEEDEYYTYVDEEGNEYEYDEFFGGFKKVFKKIKKIAHPKRVFRNITAPIRLASKIVTAPIRLVSKIIRKPSPRPRRFVSRKPIGYTSRVNASLNRPVVKPMVAFRQPKVYAVPPKPQMKMQEVKPKQAGLLDGNNKLIAVVGLMVVGGLIFYKMKPKKANA